MGLMDSVRKLASKKNVEAAKGLAAKNADKISGAVDKAASTIDQKTGGKHRDKLDKVSDTVDQKLEQLKDDGSDGPDAPEPGSFGPR